VTFEYGTTLDYGETILATPNIVTGNTNTAVSAIITGISLGTTYHYRVKAVNEFGTTYGNDMTLFYIYTGAFYQGGLIFYIDGTKQHGLVCASSDQSTGAEWGCSGTAIAGADGKEVGMGNQNTIDIVTGCTTPGIAAKICYDLELNGYSDWFLPSKDEINLMYTKLKLNGIGDFSSSWYWTSTEGLYNNPDFAGSRNMGSTNYYDFAKNGLFYVRAIRAF